MAVKDAEQVLLDIRSFLKNNLNTAINNMNTEKGDSLLSTVDSDAYITHTMNHKIANYNPFVFLELGAETPADSKPGLELTSYQFNVVIVVTAGMNDAEDDMGWKILRYNRVLKELFVDNFASISPPDKFTIETIGQVAFQLQNSDDLHRATGVQASTELTR